MVKRLMLVMVGLVALGLLVGGAYYLWLTSPVNISDSPPAAATIPSSPVSGAEDSALKLYRVDPSQSEAQYRVDETFFDRRGLVTVTGTTRAVAGEILVDPSSFAKSRVGEIVVDISQLTTDDSSRDNAIRRAYLESARYPLARFANASIVNATQPTEKTAPLRFQLSGDLTVRDVTRQVTWDVEAVIGEEVLTATATLPIKMTDFGVQPPSLAMLKVEDDIVLTLRLVARATTEDKPALGVEGCEITSGGSTVTEPIDEAPVRDKVGEGHVMRGVVRSSR